VLYPARQGDHTLLNYIIRRLLIAVPTLLFISLAIFLLLDLAPGDPTAQMPLTVPPEVREKIRLALGLGEPIHVRYLLWLKQFLINEPLHIFSDSTGWDIAGDSQRVISWQTRSPVFDIIVQRLPQTMWVVGMSYVVGILIAIPIGIISAYRQYSWFDQTGTFVTMVGYSVPPFFTGVLVIVIFSVQLGWFPSIYDTTHRVVDWDTFVFQLRQMVMPVMVLALQTTAQISRFMRASMLDNLNQDYVRTARGKGMTEKVVVLIHVLRNSLIPVITVIALGVPGIFGGAIITEQIFKVNGIGQLLITAIYAYDIPMVQTLTFIFAVLIVTFNLIADVLYGMLDPRIRYD
jgi:peptide/nickel transport system permease protein